MILALAEINSDIDNMKLVCPMLGAERTPEAANNAALNNGILPQTR